MAAWLESRLVFRLLAFNVLLVFVPAAGALYLDTYEERLLRLQERSMVQQGRLISAALSGVEPLDPSAADELIRRLGGRTEARLRVLDRNGRLVADSSRFGPPSTQSLAPAAQATRRKPLYRFGALLADAAEVLTGRGSSDDLEEALAYVPGIPLGGKEVEAALEGRYGAATRVSAGGQRSLTLYSALPIMSGEQVTGAVLVSQSTLRVLSDLYEVRLGVFRVFVISVGAAVLLSWLLARTIVRPVRRLAVEAREILDSRGRLRRGFVAPRRRDEIGELGRELEEFTSRLGQHLDSVESLAGDVAHEIKNPLAALRSAAELLRTTEDESERARLLTVIESQVARMERLLGDLREVTIIDSGNLEEGAPALDVGAVVETVVESFRERSTDGVALRLSIPEEAVSVQLDADRLSQVVENLLENALSFAPPESVVTIRLTADREVVRLEVEDEGPGVPEEHIERIFDRFFSYRPEEDDSGLQHTGLGLAIVKAIVEGHGGTVSARNGETMGAIFEIALPGLDSREGS